LGKAQKHITFQRPGTYIDSIRATVIQITDGTIFKKPRKLTEGCKRPDNFDRTQLFYKDRMTVLPVNPEAKNRIENQEKMLDLVDPKFRNVIKSVWKRKVLTKTWMEKQPGKCTISTIPSWLPMLHPDKIRGKSIMRI